MTGGYRGRLSRISARFEVSFCGKGEIVFLSFIYVYDTTVRLFEDSNVKLMFSYNFVGMIFLLIGITLVVRNGTEEFDVK